MKKFLLFVLFLCPIVSMAQEQTKIDSTMTFRISEIEVYPEYLKEYLEFAHNVGATSVNKESRIPPPIQISIIASVLRPNVPNHPILSVD